MSDASSLDPEIAAFLSQARRGFLFTKRADGSPTCHPMAVTLGEGHVQFNLYRTSVKARNAERDPQIAALVMRDWETLPGEAVVVQGASHFGAQAKPEPTGEPGGGGSSNIDVGVSVTDRVAARVDEGKRVFLRLAADGAAWLKTARQNETREG